MNDLTAKLNEIKVYLFNIKAILGLIIILYALHTGYTELSAKYKVFSEKSTANKQLETNKANLSAEEAKLKSIASELDRQTVKTVKVSPGQSPELVAIEVAQKVVRLSEETQNTYVSLKPNDQTAFNIDSAVTLPIAGGAPAAPADPNATAGGQPPADPNAPPAGNNLNAYQYTLVVKGLYVNLATFVHQLVQSPDFIIIREIELQSQTDEPGQMLEVGANPDDVIMTLRFAIPWES